MTKHFPCVLMGQSIDCLTTAVVLASLGNSVHLYSDDMDTVLAQYAFEHELVALYRLYVANGVIVPCAWQDFDADAKSLLLWVFVNDAVDGDTGTLWHKLNQSTHQDTPVILSGADKLGCFNDWANQLKRPFVFYVPFVFLVDGQAFTSMLNPSLWLVGEKTRHSIQQLSPLSPIGQAAHAAYVHDIATIEFARASIMAMLATRVSLINEMSHLADKMGIDINSISQAMGLDVRIGGSYLQAGTGFAGRTLPSEMMHLIHSFEQADSPSLVLSAVKAVNDDQKELLFRKFWCHFDGFIDHKTVMIWGGSYKSGSGRTDNAPIHPLLQLLWSYGIKTVVAADVAKDELFGRYGDQPLFALADDAYQLAGVHAIFMLNRIGAGVVDVHRLNHHCLPIFDANTLSSAELSQLNGSY